MTEPFDPYYDWLGISPDEQPPDHYRLLGVKRFESNAAAISNAADQRLRHLKSVQTGKRMVESQKLLNEVAAASTCLLNSERKQAYDQQLRQQTAASNPLPTPTPVAKPLVAQPLPTPVPVRAHESGIGLPVAQSLEAPVLGAVPFVAIDRVASHSAARKPAAANAMILLGIAGLAVMLMLGTAVGLVVWGFASQDLAVNPQRSAGRNNLPQFPPVMPVDPPVHGVTPLTPSPPISPRTVSPGPTAISTTGTTGNPTSDFPALELKTGSVLEFDGAGSAIELDRPFTVEAWLQLAPTGNPQITWETPGRARLFEGVQPSGNLAGRFVLGYGANGTTNFTSTNAKPEEWHHWAVSSDGTDLRMFMNGRLVSATKPRMPNGGSPPTGGPPLRLRAQQSGPSQVMALVRDARVSSVCRYTAAFEPPATLDVDRDTLARPDLTRSSNGALTDAAGKVQSLRLVNGARLVNVAAAGQTISTVSNDSPPPAGKLDLNVEVGPAVDLLKDVPRVLVGGDVRLEGGKLVTGGAGGDKMQFEHTPPSEYLVAAEFTREKGNEVFALQIVVEGRPCAVLIDSFADQGYYSGLEKIQNQRVNGGGHPANIRGPQLQNGKLARLRCLVVKNHVVVELDNKILVNWQGDPSTLSRDGILAIPHSSRLGIFTWDSAYSIDGLRVYPITKHNLSGANSVASTSPANSQTSSSPTTLSPAAGPIFTTMMPGNMPLRVRRQTDLLNGVQITAHSGVYSKIGNMLTIKDASPCRLEFAYEPTNDYLVEALVTRQSGRDCLALNLTVEGRPCTLIIDAFDGTRTGLELINGKRVNELPDAAQGQQLRPGTTVNVRAAVIKNRVILFIDNNRVYEWTGDPTSLQPSPDVKTGDGKNFGLSSWNSAFAIPRLTVRQIVGTVQVAGGPPSTVSPPSTNVTPTGLTRIGDLELRLGPPVHLLRDVRPTPRGGGMSWGPTSLTTSTSNQCSMEFEYEPPADYVVQGRITRKSGTELIAINVVVDGHPCSVLLDGFANQGGPLSGLETIDGKRPEENFTAVKGQVFEQEKPAELLIAVVKNRIIALVDGRTLVDWRGDPNRLSTHFKVGSAKNISVTTLDTAYEVRDLRVSPVTSSSVNTAVADGGSTPASSDNNNLGVFSSRPKQKVPDAEAQEQSKQRLKEALGDSIAKATKPDEKVKLAKQFVNVASTGEDAATRYVLLQAARKMAIAGLEFEYALSLVDHLARDYQVDAFALKLQTLQESAAITGLSTGKQEHLATLAEAFGDDAEESDRLDVLEPVSKLAFDAINKTRNIEKRKSIKAWRDRVLGEKQEWDQAQAAIENLKANPNDPEKNFLVGKFYCSLRGDWPRALPLLAKASDQAWAAAAKAELAAQDADAKYAAAEGWFALSGSAAAADKPALQSHALELFQSVAPQLAGLSKVKADKRIADLQASAAATAKAEPEKTAARAKKVGRNSYQPGLMARVIASSQPTYALGIVSSWDDFESAGSAPIRQVFGHWSSTYFHIVAAGYIVLDQDEAVKFDLENCVCTVNGTKVADTQGTGTTSIELKLKKGRHPIVLIRSDRGNQGPKFQITTVDSRKNPLFFSPQDLQVEMAKPYTYNGRTSAGMLLFGNPNP